MTTRHWGGAVGAVMGRLHPRNLSNGEYGLDGHRQHEAIVLEFAKYFGERSAGFQMTRFLTRCGYEQDADRMVADTWHSLSETRRGTLEKQERVTHVSGWWREGEQR